jgi:transcriptional regulator with XRE-family HTH domain
VGLTFQQVQKYERGANRMGSSRLFEFAKVLDVPVSHFFEKRPLRLPRESARRAGPGSRRVMMRLISAPSARRLSLSAPTTRSETKGYDGTFVTWSRRSHPRTSSAPQRHFRTSAKSRGSGRRSIDRAVSGIESGKVRARRELFGSG